MRACPRVARHRAPPARQAVDALRAVAETGADDELVSLLTVCEGAARRLDRSRSTRWPPWSGVARSASAATSRRPARCATCWAGSGRGPAPSRRDRARHDAGRAGRGAAAGATARTAAAFERWTGEPAPRRRRSPACSAHGGAAAHPGAVGGRRGADRGEDRRVHPLRAARLGYRAGRGAGPGRRRAGRPAARAGQRAVPDAGPRPAAASSRAGSTTPRCSTRSLR